VLIEKLRELLTMKSLMFTGIATTALMFSASQVCASESISAISVSPSALASGLVMNGTPTMSGMPGGGSIQMRGMQMAGKVHKMGGQMMHGQMPMKPMPQQMPKSGNFQQHGNYNMNNQRFNGYHGQVNRPFVGQPHNGPRPTYQGNGGFHGSNAGPQAGGYGFNGQHGGNYAGGNYGGSVGGVHPGPVNNGQHGGYYAGGMQSGSGNSAHHSGGFGPGFKPRPGQNGIPHNDKYRQPHQGYSLPSYWVNPGLAISNFAFFGLSTPSYGSYWSRYYDDAVLINPRGYVYDTRPGLNWDRYPGNSGYGGPVYGAPAYGAGYAPQYAAPVSEEAYFVEESDYDRAPVAPAYGPAMRADNSAYGWNDGNVSFAGNNGSNYSYDGNWQGNFVDPEARVFDGQWTGRVTRNGPGQPVGQPVAYNEQGANYAPDGDNYSNYGDENYSPPAGYGNYERCLKSNGIAGSAIGAVIGGVAGNKIAGRGDKLGGTLLGAGLGGIAGNVIQKATSKCKKHLPRETASGDYHAPGYNNGGYVNGGSYNNGGAHSGYEGGYEGGYQQAPYPGPATYPTYQGGGYYYYPQPSAPATVTVTPGTTTTTTTITETEYVTYRSVPVKRHAVAKPVRKWKPRARCTCN
jgi:hypothetical protein